MSKKSVTITNSMREEIAMELTKRAVKKAADKIAFQLDSINADYWEGHMAKVRKLSGLTDAKLKQLIKEGMIAATTRVEPQMRTKKDNGDEVGHFLCGITLRQFRDDPERISSRILRGKFPSLAKHFCNPNHRSYCIAMHFKCDSSVPRLGGMEVVSDQKLLARIKKVEAALYSMLDAADQFHKDVSMVLASCRTSKQLEDLLPEAAKLVPQPVERTTDLAPVELAKSVEKMLKNGIPDNKAGA